MMMKGLTGAILIVRPTVVTSRRYDPGSTFAAGGQASASSPPKWAKHLGVTVIGTVGKRRTGGSSPRRNGCAHTIVIRGRVRSTKTGRDEITEGKKRCPVVYYPSVFFFPKGQVLENRSNGLATARRSRRCF